MPPQIHPSGSAGDSVEAYLARHCRPSRAVYLPVVLLLLTALAMLPVLRITVSVQGEGLLRPALEKHDVRSYVSGVVAGVMVREGEAVSSGDVIVALRTDVVDAQRLQVSEQLREKRRRGRDLERLLAADALASAGAGLETAEYRQRHARLVDELHQLGLRQRQAEGEAVRVRLLVARELAPRAELERAELQLAQLRSERELLLTRHRGDWAAELAALRRELRDAEAALARLLQEHRLFSVLTPVSGTVEQLARVSPGSFVQAGEVLAIVSPDEALLAEVYVAPDDIGRLSRGTAALIQVDAFHYARWGFLAGWIDEISGDYVLVDGRPMFRVRCRLESSSLRLASGARGELKKGMTLRARFRVGERTLLELLFDDLDDWLDPRQATR